MNKQKISRAQIRKLVREEIVRLNEQQMLNEQLNEQIMNAITSALGSVGSSLLGGTASGLLGTLGSGFTDAVKDQLCTALISRFGVNRNDFLGSVVCNAFEEMELNEWWSLITGDRNRCQLMAQNLLEGMSEAIVERLINQVFEIDRNSWMYIAIVNPIIESIQNSILRNNELTGRIADGICELDISRIFQSAGANEEEARALTTAARGASGSRTTAPRTT